jgi:hypothetical protein
MERSDKLESKWEGPYVITKKTRPGAGTQGPKLEHSSKADNLRRFYVKHFVKTEAS